jgi:uncharacterized protein YjgD (DUF1641 family)
MAKAIKHIDKKQPNAVEEQTEALGEILKLIAENREAITTSLEIIKELHTAGILDVVKGALRTREKIGVIAIEQMNQPEMHRTIRNGIYAMEFLGQLDPDKLKTLFNGISHGLEKTADDHHEKIGMWGLLKAMRDPGVNASLTTMLNFLNGMGEEIGKKPLH